VTRDEVAARMLPELSDLKCRAIDFLCEYYVRPDVGEKLRERFVTAGEKYGPFDLRSINVQEELEAEALDILAYLYFGDLQKQR